jgi:hypothetical protein
MKMVGGRGRDRTGDPLLAKQVGKNTKVLRWCRLHGLSTKFSLSKCTEVVPSFAYHRRGGRDSGSWVAIAHIYKDACSLAQAKGLPSLAYHEPALEVWIVSRAAGTTSFLTIREFLGPVACS